MQIVYGNMWDEIGKADHFCITINGTVYYRKNRDRLVMGAGIAGQVERRLPCAPYFFGEHIRAFGQIYNAKDRLFEFGIARPDLRVTQTPDGRVRPCSRHETDRVTEIVGFQVKHYFGDDADLRLVEKSVNMLAELAGADMRGRWALNFPAIGYGGLEPETVMPLLETLPDNVVVYRYINDQRIVDV